MTKIVDARGLSCPQPVLMTLDEINTGESSPLEVLVDTETAMENVSRRRPEPGVVRVGDPRERGGLQDHHRKG